MDDYIEVIKCEILKRFTRYYKNADAHYRSAHSTMYETFSDIVKAVCAVALHVRNLDPRQPSKLLVWATDDELVVLDGTGYEWSYWSLNIKTSIDLGEHGVDTQFRGLVIWEGHFYDNDGADKLQGEFRLLTSEEVFRVSNCLPPWEDIFKLEKNHG